MAANLVYFDLETRRTANDVGGWGKKHLMGISVGVTYSSKAEDYMIYTEDQANELIQQLVRADLVVGFNHISFDYEVLMGHSIFDFRDQLRSLDLMVDLEQKLGHRIKLEAVAAATLGTGKSADGLQAIRWWQEGKLLEIAEYCCYDVKVTRLVHEYGARHGHVKYHDRNGREQTVEVAWSLEP
ncbi:MAG: ribonuclease H-like domain-containing protein [Verrucomicrobiales bacterium]|nr:ribonuclease H-like domain-containing protein [Verrucomicrobiales bacterium]